MIFENRNAIELIIKFLNKPALLALAATNKRLHNIIWNLIKNAVNHTDPNHLLLDCYFKFNYNLFKTEMIVASYKRDLRFVASEFENSFSPLFTKKYYKFEAACCFLENKIGALPFKLREDKENLERIKYLFVISGRYPWKVSKQIEKLQAVLQNKFKFRKNSPVLESFTVMAALFVESIDLEKVKACAANLATKSIDNRFNFSGLVSFFPRIFERRAEQIFPLLVSLKNYETVLSWYF